MEKMEREVLWNGMINKQIVIPLAMKSRMGEKGGDESDVQLHFCKASPKALFHLFLLFD